MLLRSVPVCISLCLLLLCRGALADDKTLSLKHFKAGISFIKADNYESAVSEFEKSMSLYPNKGALFNLANSYKALFRYTEALEAFERLRGKFGTKLEQEMLLAAKRSEQEIRDLAAELEIHVNRNNAAVLLNGQSVGKSPVPKRLILLPGEYVIAVSLEGYEGLERDIQAVAGTKQVETFELVPQDDAQPAATKQSDVFKEDSSDDDKGKPSPLKPIFWSGAAGTLAVGIVAGVFWGLAGSRHADYKATNNQIANLPSDEAASMSINDKQNLTDKRNNAGEDVENYGNIALGLSIGAGALAVATAVVLALDLSHKNKGERSPVSIGPGTVNVSF